MNVILSLARSVDPSELEETTSDFILSLLDADEHLDIKINRFGGSTTPAICGKHVLHSYSGLYLMAQGLKPSLQFQLCAKNLIEVFLSHNFQSNEMLIFTTRFRYQSQEQQLKW